MHGSHGAGQFNGSQTRLLGQGWFAEHGRLVQPAGSGAAGSRQKPHAQCPVALQVAFAKVLQPCAVGHCPLVLKHAAPGHSQQTGGGVQPHFPVVVSLTHCDPVGKLGGHGPVQPTSGSS